MLKTKLPPFVHRERTRHGKSVYYVRRGTGPRIRLYAAPGAPEFDEAYSAALEGAKWRPKAKPDVPETKNRQRVEAHLQRMLWKAAERAKIKGRGFDLDMEWALDQVIASGMRCPMSGIPFFMSVPETNRGVHPYAPSIDRVDSALGYTRDNCRVVVFALNAMMLDWGEEVFARVANGYRSTKSKR